MVNLWQGQFRNNALILHGFLYYFSEADSVELA